MNENGVAPPVKVAHDPVQVGALLSKLDQVLAAIKEGNDTEDTLASDQTYVVGGAPTAAAAISIAYPRTWRHVEITASCCPATANNEVAIFDGQLLLTDVQNRHQHTNGQVQQSDALMVVSSGTVTIRALLNQTGFLTIYFTGAYTGYVNIRMRVLDRSQSRAVGY